MAKRLTAMLDGTLIVTIAAQAAVLPLILCYFGRLSPVSLLTNCLVLPVQPAILAGGIAALLAGAAWQPLGQAVGTRALAASELHRGRGARDGCEFRSRRSTSGASARSSSSATMPCLSGHSPSRVSRVCCARHPDLRRAGAWSALFIVPLVPLLPCLASPT